MWGEIRHSEALGRTSGWQQVEEGDDDIGVRGLRALVSTEEPLMVCEQKKTEV